MQRRRVAVTDRLLPRGLSLIVSSGSATSISLRFGSSPRRRSAVTRVSSAQNGSVAAGPGLVPVAVVAVGVEVTGVEAGERVVDVADLVVLWSVG